MRSARELRGSDIGLRPEMGACETVTTMGGGEAVEEQRGHKDGGGCGQVPGKHGWEATKWRHYMSGRVQVESSGRTWKDYGERWERDGGQEDGAGEALGVRQGLEEKVRSRVR